MQQHMLLQHSDASLIVEACKKKSEALGIGVSVVILDQAGHTMMLVRFDNAQFQTPDVARGKALTAVMMKRSSKDIENITLSRPTMMSFTDGRLPIQGALPLIFNQQCVGAVGVSGGTPDQDEQIAQSGADAFNAQL